jgi:uncharacterized protein YkwD
VARHRIHARRLLPLALVCTAFALPTGTVAAASPCADADLAPTDANVDTVRTATLCLLNQERTSRSLGVLTSNRNLLKAASRYSRLMVKERFFAHVSPSGSTLLTRVRSGTGYLRGAHSWTLGENLAWGSGELATPANIVRAWMHSPGHRHNILTPAFRHIGIGVVTGAPQPTQGVPAATYTTDFGRRS